MTKRKWLFGVVAIALVALAALGRGIFSGDNAAAKREAMQRAVPVDIAKAERKMVPVKLDALGTVTPIASVALKPRVDTTITEVHFEDGARVEKGKVVLFITGPSRA